jgi:hypothetical protein
MLDYRGNFAAHLEGLVGNSISLAEKPGEEDKLKGRVYSIIRDPATHSRHHEDDAKINELCITLCHISLCFTACPELDSSLELVW